MTGRRDGEGQRGVEVVGAGVEDRPHEVGAGHGAVLEDLDGPEGVGRRAQGRGEGRGIQDVGREPARPDAVTGELGCQFLQVPGVAGDEGDAVAGGSEAAGGGEPEARTGADEGKGGHERSFVGRPGPGGGGPAPRWGVWVGAAEPGEGLYGAGRQRPGPATAVRGQGLSRALIARRSSIAW
ncbi:hypothetical protein SVIOM74S_05377 [Streptomyces violarus]